MDDMPKRSGYMRVKPHVQIAIELLAIDMQNQRRRKSVTASEAIWALITECRSKIASEAVERAKEEGYPVPSDKSGDNADT